MRCSSVLWSLALTFGIVAPAIVAAQGGSVAGTVVNRATGAPVAAAQVTVAGTALRAFTDASGKFARLEARKTNRKNVVTAIARELAGFVWAEMTAA